MYFTDTTKKIFISFGAAAFLALCIGYIFFMPTTEKTEAVAIPTTTVPQETTVPPTLVSCQDTTILFDINTSDPIVSLESINQCFTWFADQINRGVFTKINVIGRSSCDSSKENGNQISQERANLVALELMKYGVPNFQINAQGIGYSNPIGDCKSTKGAIANRSVIISGE